MVFILVRVSYIECIGHKNLLINGCQFSVNEVNNYGELYVYDYFYTEKECRKLKLKNIGYEVNGKGYFCSG